jgi:uncharacterized protein
MDNHALSASRIFTKLKSSPMWVRVVPFVVFLLLTGLQGQLGDASRFWIYGLKTIVGFGMIWAVWSSIPEMRWKFSLEAVLAGTGVFIMWVSLDEIVRRLGVAHPFHRLPSHGTPWNPILTFGANSFWAWALIAVRIIGSGFIVPPLEEVFYRSFIYRFIIQPNFNEVPFNRLHPTAFIVSSALFALEHQEWLAGFLCGLVYQSLVVKRGRLGDAIAAHTVTNVLLGFYVVARGAWQFW